MTQERFILIERPTQTKDSHGAPTVTWASVCSCRAEIQDVLPSRSESVKQGLTMARNQTRLRMRWRSDIDSTMRVTVYGDTNVVYQIIGGPAEIMGRKERLEMMLERYSTAGA